MNLGLVKMKIKPRIFNQQCDKSETKGRSETLIHSWRIFTASQVYEWKPESANFVFLYDRLANDKSARKKCSCWSRQIAQYRVHYLVHGYFTRLWVGSPVKQILIGNEVVPWRTFVRRFLSFDREFPLFCVNRAQYLVNKRLLEVRKTFREL